MGLLVTTATAAETQSVSEQLFDDDPGHYNYCPSYLRTPFGTRWIFYCANKNPKEVIDYICFRRKSPFNAWSSHRIAIAPSASEWDCVHVCDPDVLKGSFRDGKDCYRYALFYLGCDRLDCTYNQLGLAVAKRLSGPWKKWHANPLVTAKQDGFWGVGQPSAVSLDGKGKVLLFYTRGTAVATGMFVAEVDLSDLNRVTLGKEIPLITDGLTERDERGIILNNGAVALDSKERILYLVRDRHPSDPEVPHWISTEVQVASIPLADLLSQRGTWSVTANITPSLSGKPRNHNACILKDLYGFLPNRNKLEIAFSVSDLGDNWLWTYRIGSTQLRPLR